MKFKDDLDYVEFYAEKLKNDNRFFSQQKMLIESQMRASSSLFRKMFGKNNFESNARQYLRKVGLLED